MLPDASASAARLRPRREADRIRVSHGNCAQQTYNSDFEALSAKVPTATRSRKASASAGGCDFAVDPFPTSQRHRSSGCLRRRSSVVILASVPSCVVHADGSQLPPAAMRGRPAGRPRFARSRQRWAGCKLLAATAAPAAAVIPLSDRGSFR